MNHQKESGFSFLGLVGLIIIVVSVLAFPRMYINFFEFVIDSVVDGSNGIFKEEPKQKNLLLGPNGKSAR